MERIIRYLFIDCWENIYVCSVCHSMCANERKVLKEPAMCEKQWAGVRCDVQELTSDLEPLVDLFMHLFVTYFIRK